MQTVQLDPYVALSILDHHQRRGVDKDRVEGVLLGSTVKSTIQIRGYVPSLSNKFFQSISRLSPKDLVVGWYVTAIESEDRKIEACSNDCWWCAVRQGHHQAPLPYR